VQLRVEANHALARVPILNTCFNDHGEPIPESYEAIEAFLAIGVDGVDLERSPSSSADTVGDHATPDAK
jgi:hypothetical protein